MKWIRTVVTVVIMIVSVGVIALGINNLTQKKVKEEVVTFEVLTENTVTSGTYDLINTYIVLDNYMSTNVISIIFNSSSSNINKSIYYNDSNFSYHITDDGIADTFISIYPNDIIGESDYNIKIGDIWEITFDLSQPPQLTGTIAIILGLVPLIVASGVLYFMLRKNNIGD